MTNNIISIDRTPVGSLLGLRRVGAASVSLSANTPWERLDIRVPARLTVTDKIEEGVRMHTAQLVFRTCADVDRRERMAYRATSADGRQYLIGSDRRPYPVATVSENHPDNMADNMLPEVTVSYTSVQRPPSIEGASV